MKVKFSSPAVAGLLLSAAAGLAAPAAAQTTATPVPDSTFVQMAGSGGLAEVQLGKLAQRKASSEAVKQFGRRMVADHSKANQELMAAAQNAGLNPPSSLLPMHRQVADRLAKQQGAAFDTAYMAAMVKDHAEEVQLFRQRAQGGQAESLTRFASETLPVLQEHLRMSKALAAQVGADTAAAATAHAEHEGSTR